MMRACWRAQGALLDAVWGLQWEGNPKKREHMYTHG